MFEIYNNSILSVEASWLYGEADIMSQSNYKLLAHRGKINVLRRGCKGTPALVEYDSIPQRFKDIIVDKYGDPKGTHKNHSFTEMIEPDDEARKFYSSFRLQDGRNLKPEVQRQYICEAEILNACKLIIDKSAKRKALGGTKTNVWSKLSEIINQLDKASYPHKLPTDPRRLKGDKNTRSYNRYIKNGYTGLIHKGYCNNNSRKVTAQIESLILSLYCLPNKPFSASVHDLYLQFLGGAIDVVDIKSGELFDREDFYDKGVPVTISEATVWNYLKDPKNELIIKKQRNGNYDFSHKQRPHVNRTAPNYSLSKISLDDRDIMHTKLPNGRKVMAYYAFDDMSQALIGYAHSKEKTHQLFIDCIKNMFLFLNSKNLGMPMQMEVEHHLVRDFRDGLMRAGNVFPFVRWCNPTNSQEKYAERLIGSKKYGAEKNNNQNVGRHYSRRDSNRVINQKIFDAQNDNYKEATADYDVIVANEIQEIREYNNQLHPNQKKYKGMSRMDVFMYHTNPNLAEYDKPLLARYIGEHTQTSIRRSQYVQLLGDKYQLESPEVLNRLAPNNLTVDAYYIPEANGEIKDVYLYQNEGYIANCKPVPTFNRANAEWTEQDKEGYQEAMSYISKFDKMVKEDSTERLNKLEIVKNTDYNEDIEVVVVEDEIQEEDFDQIVENYESTDINQSAFDSL